MKLLLQALFLKEVIVIRSRYLVNGILKLLLEFCGDVYLPNQKKNGG